MKDIKIEYLLGFRDIPKALRKIGLGAPLPVVVIVGGANDINPIYWKTIHDALEVLLSWVEEHKAAVVDGGTSAGVMEINGKIKKERNLQFPLVGVAVSSLVTIPESPRSNGKIDLQSNHSHFFLVKGNQWGHESVWMSKIATSIAQGHPSVTVLLNGGDISAQDIQNSLAEKRPVLAIRGTGRLADTLPEKPDCIYAVHSGDEQKIIHVMDSIMKIQARSKKNGKI